MIYLHQDPVASTSSSISTPQSVVPTVSTNPMDIFLFIKRSLTNQEKVDIWTNVLKPPEMYILNSPQHSNESQVLLCYSRHSMRFFEVE